MAILVHRYDAPDRFVAGTVGQPGERAFFLQAREGNRITSVACEKQQVSVLAEHLDRVLDEVIRRSSGPSDVPPAAKSTSDTDPLDAPITEEFRVGTMTIAWDPSIDKIVIELFSNVEVEDDAEESSTPTRCSWSRSPRPMPATSWPAPRRWSQRAGPRARSACSRSTRTATSARARTATAVPCSDRLALTTSRRNNRR
jgi:uncharacterized repeat protein (TIGR03847 family)